MKAYLPLFGRMGISLVFILFGLEKSMDFEHSRHFLAVVGYPDAPVLVIISIIIEFVGGILVLIGYHVKITAMIMAAYVLLTTAIFYPIWSDLSHYQDFIKNLAIIGGLLILSYHGAGPKSLDSNEL